MIVRAWNDVMVVRLDVSSRSQRIAGSIDQAWFWRSYSDIGFADAQRMSPAHREDEK
jgi:hypothetical protein